MKRIQINTAKMLLPALLAVTLFSCVRKDNFFPGDSPSTRTAIVKIFGYTPSHQLVQGGTPAVVVKNPIDFVSTSQKLWAIDLRRDPNDQGDLNTTMTVVVKEDTAGAHAVNPNYLFMPSTWYSIESESPRVGGLGGTYTFVFKPGEFAKQINITIPDATLLDPSSLYAFSYTITTITGSGKISAAKSVIIEIGAKNDWDGVYAVTGPMIDAASSTLTQWNNPAPSWGDPFPPAHGGGWELHLITFGAARCYMYDNTIWGDYFHPILSGGTSNSGYGSFALIVDFNKATNTVSNVTNLYGTTAYGGSGAPGYVAGNGRSAELDPSGVNAVQGNKDILIRYWMNQPSVIAGHRTSFDEKWTYVGPR